MKRLAIIAIIGGLLASQAAMASCDLDGPGRCVAEFRELLGVTADGARRLVAVGQLRTPPAPGREVALATVVPPGPPIGVAPPTNLPNLDGRPLSYVEGREIVRLSAGEFAVFGIAIYGEGQAATYAGWAARVGLDGRTRWSLAYPGPRETHNLFHSGLAASDGRLLAAGRRQLGPDPGGDCSAWSRALILPIDAETGSALPGEIVDGAGRERRAFYAGAEYPGQGFLFTGFATGPDARRPGKCQDDFLYQRFDASLQVIDRQQFGHPTGNDIGFRVAILDDTIFLAGAGVMDSPSAFLDSVPVAGGVPISFRRTVGEGGRDYFTAIARHPVAGDTIVAGAWSETASAWYRAWWFRLGDDMVPTEEVAVRAYPGSSISGVGILPDGTAVGVGYVRTEPGVTAEQYGWVVDIDPGGSAPALPVLTVRPADSSLPPLDGLETRDGAFLAGSLRGAPLAYYHGPAEGGARYELAFDVGTATGLRIVVHPEGGDIDAVLRDEDGRLVDFSNYRRIATEVLEAAAQPRRYRLQILVNDPVAGFDVVLAAIEPAGFPDSITGPVSLDGRRDLASALAGSGYFPGSEIEISVSPETIRAFIAAQSAVGQQADGVVDQGALGQIVRR